MNISGNDAWISWIFLHGYIHQVKVASEATDFGCMYLGMPNQMCVRPKIRNREAQNETWGMPEETEETQGEPKGNV